MAEELEKIFIIPLKQKGHVSSKAAPMAMTRVKNFLIKHMKTTKENIWIDESVNHEIWKRGKYKMPNKIQVKAVKFEDGVVEAYLPELTFEKSRREILKEEKAKKQPILKKEGEEAELPEEEPGAEDYEVVPAADGEVKIKKKKQHKEKPEDTAGEPAEPKAAKKPPAKKTTKPAHKKKAAPKPKETTPKKPAAKKKAKAAAPKTKKASK